MHRRELLGTLGLTAALTTVNGGNALAAAADDKDKDDIHEKCADACFDCAQECSEAFHHCFTQLKNGKADYAKALHLCVDCAEICSTSGKLVSRMSPIMMHTCHACAAACDACLAVCDKLADSGLKDCTEALRKCSGTCKDMVKSMGGHTSR